MPCDALTIQAGRTGPAALARHTRLAFGTGVSKALLQMERVLLSHGISKLAPTGCGPFVAREHAVVSASASGKLPADGETVMVAETVRAGYRHDATGAVLRRAKVGLAPAPLASPAGPSSAGAEARGRGGQATPERDRAERPSLAIELRDRAAPETAEHLHDVAGSDTLQGLAVRFGVQPGALLRLYP